MKNAFLFLALLLLITACDKKKEDTDNDDPPTGKYHVWYSSKFITFNNYVEFQAGDLRRDSSIIGPSGQLEFLMNDGDSILWKIWGDHLYQESQTYIVIDEEVYVRCQGNKKMESRYLLSDTMQTFMVHFIYKSDVPDYSYGYTIGKSTEHDYENGNGTNIISASAMSGDTLTTYIDSGSEGTGEAVIMLNGNVAARVVGTEGDGIYYILKRPGKR